MTTAQSVVEFWAAPDEALFTQPIVESVLGVSPAWCERGRWAGYGPRYLKLGHLVRYRKADILSWIDQHRPVSSTAEYGRARETSEATPGEPPVEPLLRSPRRGGRPRRVVQPAGPSAA